MPLYYPFASLVEKNESGPTERILLDSRYLKSLLIVDYLEVRYVCALVVVGLHSVIIFKPAGNSSGVWYSDVSKTVFAYQTP